MDEFKAWLTSEDITDVNVKLLIAQGFDDKVKLALMEAEDVDEIGVAPVYQKRLLKTLIQKLHPEDVKPESDSAVDDMGEALASTSLKSEGAVATTPVRPSGSQQSVTSPSPKKMSQKEAGMGSPHTTPEQRGYGISLGSPHTTPDKRGYGVSLKKDSLSLVTRTGWSQDVIISDNICVLVVNKIPTKQVAGLNRPVGELAVADSTGCIKCLVYDSKRLYNQLAVDKMYTISNFKRRRQDYLIFNDETVCQDVVPQYMIEAANKLLDSPKKSVNEVLAMTEEEAKGVAFTLCGIVKEIDAPDVRRNQFKDALDFIDSIPSSWSLGALLGEDGEPLMPVIKFTVKDNETADEILVYFWEGENSIVTTRDIMKGDSGDTVQMTNVKLKNWPGKTVTNTYKTEIRFQHKQPQNGSPLKRTAGEEVDCCSPVKVEKLC